MTTNPSIIHISDLPPQVSSYDVWEFLHEAGIEADLIVTEPESSKRPWQMCLRLANPTAALFAMSKLQRAPFEGVYLSLEIEGVYRSCSTAA